MERMNSRFSKRGLHLTILDYALVVGFIAQTILVVITVSGNG
jgi:hypothetical protein